MANETTVGDLKRELGNFPDDWQVMLPGNLTFYRLKARGENLVAIEVNEPETTLKDDSGRTVLAFYKD